MAVTLVLAQAGVVPNGGTSRVWYVVLTRIHDNT